MPHSRLRPGSGGRGEGEGAERGEGGGYRGRSPGFPIFVNPVSRRCVHVSVQKTQQETNLPKHKVKATHPTLAQARPDINRCSQEHTRTLA